MNKRELKKKITEAYESETPDLRVSIIASCLNEAQERKSAAESQPEHHTSSLMNLRVAFKPIAVAAICLMLFISGLSIGRYLPGADGGSVSSAAETLIYLDVNPSIELRMDAENKIVDVVAGNEDAEIVLSDLQLSGLDINTALKAIVGSMYVNGYLSENSNSVLISVNSKNEETADSLLVGITEQINAVFENSNMECAIIAQCLTVDERLTREAREYGVSVGKMHLLKKIASSFGNLSREAIYEMSDLSINDLNLIYSQRTVDNESEHEYISGTARVDLTPEEALESVLAQIGKSKDDISSSCVFLRPSKSGEAKVAYGVNLEMPGDSNLYKYEVDCQSGEVFMVITFPTLTGNGVIYRDILFSVTESETQ